MSIMEKVFKYDGIEVPLIKYKDEIWIKTFASATILKYKNTMKSIRDYVDPEDKRKLPELRSKSKQNETDPVKSKQNESFRLKMTSESRGSKMDPLKRNEGNTIYINESGLYSLILCSKLESAHAFKRWVTKDVLPSIRKMGRYVYDDMNHKYNDSLTFKIKNETDYCEECTGCYSIKYMDRHHRTYKHQHNLLILEMYPEFIHLKSTTF